MLVYMLGPPDVGVGPVGRGEGAHPRSTSVMPEKILSKNKFCDPKLTRKSSEGRRATLKSAGCLFQVITNKTRSFENRTCL